MIAARQVVKLVAEIAVAIIENAVQNQFEKGDCQDDQHAAGEEGRHDGVRIRRYRRVVWLHEVPCSDSRHSLTVFTSLSPRPERFTITVWSLFISAATLIA